MTERGERERERVRQSDKRKVRKVREKTAREWERMREREGERERERGREIEALSKKENKMGAMASIATQIFLSFPIEIPILWIVAGSRNYALCHWRPTYTKDTHSMR